MHHDHQAPVPAHQVGDLVLFGASSLWAAGVAVWKCMPSWELVPPLCFGVAALIRAWKTRPPKALPGG